MNKQTPTGKMIEPLINLLASKNEKVRNQARKSLESIGKPAVSSLSHVLQTSKEYDARWQAAKALGTIGYSKSIPALVLALEDPEFEVRWLAAVALKKFQMAAWPELLKALISHGADSIKLRDSAHHVLGKQQAIGLNDLLEVLRKSLESGAVLESTPVAAFNLLKKIRAIQPTIE